MSVTQSLTQEQLLKQQQVQRLTAQQVLQVRLLEMPLAQIEQNIKAELNDNPALESAKDDDNDDFATNESSEIDDNHDDGMDADGTDSSDDMGDNGEELFGERRPGGMGSNSDNADRERDVYGDSQSFYNKIMEQVADEDLDDRQTQIMEYLVGSLDDQGYLRKDVMTLSDELAIYCNMDCTDGEIQEMIDLLKTFDPAGIGAKDVRECLLLQIARREPSTLRTNMAIVIHSYFDEFMKKHWEKLRQHLKLTQLQIDTVIAELRRLNPSPGASMGETMGSSTQQITPDFIIETDYNGRVTFQLNQGDIPRLYVSEDFEQQYRGFQSNPESMTRSDKEAFLFLKEKIERARGYIEAVERRRNTMTITMKAIIERQQKFFLDGDESDIVPMTLKDIADRTGLDISTVSRVCNSKYADTPWGIFRLRHFFSEGYSVGDNDEEVSTRKIKLALKDLIEGEDKRKPLSDDALSKILKEKGFPIARRTVAKYREQLGLPVARLRK